MKKYLLAVFIFSLAHQGYAQIGNGTSTASSTTTSLGVPLPLELLSFDAKANEGKSLLQWTVFNTTAIKSFVIQKSLDGRQWEDVTTMMASEETTKKNYEYSDNYPVKGQNFYRLLIANPDGTNSYTHVASVLHDGKKLAFYTYPNPAVSNINIVAPVPGTVTLTNAEGRVLIMNQLAPGTTSFDLQQFASGSYWLRYQHDDMIETIHISKR